MRCYDIGSSTGTLLLKLSSEHLDTTQFCGIEPQEEMNRVALNKLSERQNIDLINDDIFTVELGKSNLVILYYTLHFIHPMIRQEVLNKIYESLNWGGALILFEKVRAPDARFQDISSNLYTQYKLEKGYTGEEIINKTMSLNGILEPFSTNGNIDMLKRAGFVDINSILKYVCFEGFLCIK